MNVEHVFFAAVMVAMIVTVVSLGVFAVWDSHSSRS